MRRNKVLRGFGTVFKRENKYYVYQYRDLNGKIKITVLKNDQGGKITTFTEAKIAAVKIYEEVDQIQKLQSKVEYLHNVAIEKHIINLKQIQLGNIWDNYLANPNRPDSGKRTLETYEGILKAFLEYCSDHQIQEPSQLTPEFAGEIHHRINPNFKISIKKSCLQFFAKKSHLCKLVLSAMVQEK